MRVAGMQGVRQIVLQHGRAARREIPQEPAGERGIDRPMADQALDVGDEVALLSARAMQMGVDRVRLPQTERRDRRHHRGEQEEEDAHRVAGALQFQPIAQDAAERQRREHRQRRPEIPQRADAPRHRQLLADGRTQSVPGAPQKQKAAGSRQRADQQHGERQRQEGEDDVDDCGEAGEQDQITAVAQAERTPEIAHDAEGEREIGRNRCPKREGRQAVRRQVQLVLEHEGERDDLKTAGGIEEVQRHDHRAAIDEDARALGAGGG